MKKLLCLLLLLTMVIPAQGFAATKKKATKKPTAKPTATPPAHKYKKMWNGRNFDMAYFLKRTNVITNKGRQYKITIDDMEDGGSITPVTQKSSHTIRRMIFDVEPKIILNNYKNSQFMPLPVISILYGGNDWYFFKYAIIKIGNKTYRFDGIDTSTDLIGGFCFETLTLFIDSTHKDFIEKWIANTGAIKIRLSGTYGSIDFNFNSETKRNMNAMIRDYKYAGGKISDFTVVHNYGLDYNVILEN